MNIILFNNEASAAYISATDPRFDHIQKVLKRGVGEHICVGVVNQRRGKARIQRVDTNGISLDIEWDAVPPPLFAVRLLIGLPRPQTARKILLECTTLGAERIDFYASEKGESSYAQSSLWTTDEWKNLLWQGAEQAFCTHLPQVYHYDKLKTAVNETVQSGIHSRIALDNYEAGSPLGKAITATPLQLVIGGERGFSARERDCLRENNYQLCHLGERVLRTETAAVASLAIVLSLLNRE